LFVKYKTGFNIKINTSSFIKWFIKNKVDNIIYN
jgi:hypothetical protein